MMVSIGVSNRHVHITRENYQILFGNIELEKVRDLNQPGEFASNQFVTVKTDDGEIEKVRVLGPFRNYTQVEISKTDAYKLNLDPPIRNSGDLEESETVTLIGPCGELLVKNCCIIPTRHIHLTKEHAKAYGLEGKETVNVKLNGKKGGIITNVYLKYSDNAYFELHLDTDDANAHLIKNGDIGEIL